MTYRLSLLLLLAVVGCSPSWHLKKAIQKGAQVKVDTVYKTVSVVVPETRIDTVLTNVNFRDTIVVSKDKIVTKIKYDTVSRRLYVHTLQKADTVFIEVPITVTKKIETGMPYWWLAVAAGIFLVIILKTKKR